MIRYSWLISFNFSSPCSFRCIKTLWARHRVSSNGSFQRSMLPCFMWCFSCEETQKTPQATCVSHPFASSMRSLHHPRLGDGHLIKPMFTVLGVEGRPVYVPSDFTAFAVPKMQSFGMSCWQADVATGKARCTYKHLFDVIKVVEIYDVSKQWSQTLEFVLLLLASWSWKARLRILSRILEGGIDHSPHCHPCPLSLFASHSVFFYFYFVHFTICYHIHCQLREFFYMSALRHVHGVIVFFFVCIAVQML